MLVATYILPGGDEWLPERRARQPKEWSQALKDTKAAREPVLCGCRGRGDKRLYVSIRGKKVLLSRWPGSGIGHDVECEHYGEPPSMSGLGGYTQDAIIDMEGGLQDVKLSVSLRPRLRSEAKPGGATAEPVVEEERRSGSRRGDLTELALLHHLWSRAGLNRWFPKMRDRRTWGSVANALRTAGGDLRSSGLYLSDVMFLVPPSCESWRRGSVSDWNAAVAEKGTGGAPNRLLVIGEAERFSSGRSALRLFLKDDRFWGVTVFASLEWEGRLRRRYERSMNLIGLPTPGTMPSSRVVALVVGDGRLQDGRLVVSAQSIALMPVTQCFIPFDSSYERIIADELVAQDRIFSKPLRYDTAMGLHPDFLLHDGEHRPHPLEVYGMLNNPEYAKRRIAKRRLYLEQFGIQAWEWLVDQEQLPPPFPPKVHRRS